MLKTRMRERRKDVKDKDITVRKNYDKHIILTNFLSGLTSKIGMLLVKFPKGKF